VAGQGVAARHFVLVCPTAVHPRLLPEALPLSAAEATVATQTPLQNMQPKAVHHNQISGQGPVSYGALFMQWSAEYAAAPVGPMCIEVALFNCAHTKAMGVLYACRE
jgi:hypothetical protein